MFFDTHCHLDFETFAEDRARLVREAYSQGVTKLFVPGVAPRCWAEQARVLGEFCHAYFGFGVHPFWVHELDEDFSRGLGAALEIALRQHGAIAIGECGLDALHARRLRVSLDLQVGIFEQQLQLAKRLNLPVVIHCVKAHGRVLDCLDRFGPLPAGGVMHAYSGPPELVQRYLSHGLYFGFGGAVTRPNAKRARASLRRVPLERLVLETDAPDQAPHWLAGGRNEPAQLIKIAERVAELRGCPLDQLAEQTLHNGCRLFRIS